MWSWYAPGPFCCATGGIGSGSTYFVSVSGSSGVGAANAAPEPTTSSEAIATADAAAACRIRFPRMVHPLFVVTREQTPARRRFHRGRRGKGLRESADALDPACCTRYRLFGRVDSVTLTVRDWPSRRTVTRTTSPGCFASTANLSASTELTSLPAKFVITSSVWRPAFAAALPAT